MSTKNLKRFYSNLPYVHETVQIEAYYKGEGLITLCLEYVKSYLSQSEQTIKVHQLKYEPMVSNHNLSSSYPPRSRIRSIFIFSIALVFKNLFLLLAFSFFFSGAKVDQSLPAFMQKDSATKCGTSSVSPKGLKVIVVPSS